MDLALSPLRTRAGINGDQQCTFLPHLLQALFPLSNHRTVLTDAGSTNDWRSLTLVEALVNFATSALIDIYLSSTVSFKDLFVQ